MTERENLPSKIVAQDVVVTTQRGSLVARGLQAVENSKQKALTKNNEVNTTEEQYRLGVKYDSGDGVPQDYEEAVKWYRLAADQGDTDAQNNLDNMDKLTSKEMRFAQKIGLGHLTNDPEALAVARAQYSKNLDAKMEQGRQSYAAQKIKDEMPSASLKSNTNTGSLKQEKTLNQPMQSENMQKQTEDPKDTDSNEMSLIEWLRTLPPGGKLTIKLPEEK